MKKWALILTLFFLNLASLWAGDVELCPTVIIRGHESLSFTETERRLVCGDSEVRAYQNIPAYQAGFSMTGFLQSRGYLNSAFEYENEKLIVLVGKKTSVGTILVQSENEEINKIVQKEIHRIFRKNIVTPSLLNSIESSALSELRQNGFACAKVKSSIDVTSGLITIQLENLKPFYFQEFSKEEIEGVYSEALARFYPFRTGDLFNEQQLELTEKRFLRSGVVQGTYFSEVCEDEDYKFEQRFIVGPPRTIRFGIGASTEVGPMARVKWSNQRYGPMASLLEANLQVSFKSQSLNLLAENFFWSSYPRRSLLSEFEIIRSDQSDYEEITTSFKPHLKFTRDKHDRFWSLALGPTILSGRYKTDRDRNAQTFTTGAIGGEFLTMTHSYEVFDIHPIKGNYFNFNFDYRDPAFGFIEPLLKLDTSFLKFLRLGDWGRGSAIFGIRLSGGVTWVREDTNVDKLPPSVKYYGGGSDDIRGFKLNALPENGGQGALTKTSLKLELRKTHFFVSKLEAFGFIDGAYFGQTSWEIDSNLWYSPGVGIRWLSPIGIVQTYLAKAYVDSTDKGDYFFLGLGGVF